MRLTSPDFASGACIPERFSCEGENINPTLEIFAVSEGTRSLVLILDDPDAPGGTWTHWVLWNIPPITVKIESGFVPEGACVGVGSSGVALYEGPCPPLGKHRYIFTLYALDAVLNIPHESDKKALQECMVEHIISQTELVGVYSRYEE